MNAERILKLADVIEAAPHEAPRQGDRRAPLTAFSMQRWHCGTVGCIAGWAHQLFGDGTLPEYEDEIQISAADFLGLSSSAADNLFVPPSSLFGGLGQITPRQASDVLRNLAETGAVNWSVAS